jgi:hypothetical protein
VLRIKVGDERTPFIDERLLAETVEWRFDHDEADDGVKDNAYEE